MAVLEEIDKNTVVIPGHGAIGSYRDFLDYLSMLKTIRERIAALIAEGATLEDVIAANPTAEWEELKGNPRQLLDRAYKSLSR